MHAIYNTLEDIPLEAILSKDIILKNILSEDMIVATQNINNQLHMNFILCRRKLVFELGDKVYYTRKLVNMYNNNRTVRVNVDGKLKTFVVKNLKKLHE
ncbi:6728_t:CDS:2 [Cetraspora pellucida]|uniref:6728_t:CDS:1 n=1 Tax=Cetraspora pellucida TaxID=1433469 RepID=A0A9N9NDJ2_9GLOM|nr:6728_t:CDS:2 [Cetraspora pellucida]